mgnify:CR=1 FL=1
MKDSLTEFVVCTILVLLVITVTVSAILLVESIWGIKEWRVSMKKI